MRILQVIHQFPPYSSQGSEVYCLNLSRELIKKDEVRVFHVSNAPGRWRRRLVREQHLGIPTYYCVDLSDYARVANWPNSFLQTSFKTALDEFAPDIVHFHNYLSLADDLVGMARSWGAAVVYTLHDFGLICPNTLLFRSDGKLCTKDSSDFFQDCCPTLIRTTGKGRPLLARHLPSLARWRSFSQQFPQPLLRAALLQVVRGAEWLWGEPSKTDIPRKRDFFFTHARGIFQMADIFLSPSRFLLQRYVQCGLPSSKIQHLRLGMRLSKTIKQNKTHGPVRFGYIGALHPQKGIELLLDAFKGLGDRASLHIHGSVFNSPVSKNYWQRIREQNTANIIFHGAYDNERVHEVLDSIDVVVVPSLWYENSPLTIHEAFAARVPVITADHGGMAELVRAGIDGLHFRHGDSADLRRTLLEVIEDPQIVDRLRQGIPNVLSIEEHVDELRRVYENLVR